MLHSFQASNHSIIKKYLAWILVNPGTTKKIVAGIKIDRITFKDLTSIDGRHRKRDYISAGDSTP